MSQQSTPNPERGARFREALASLDLTPEQQGQVRQAVQKAMAGGGAGGGAVLRELATVLTPEQTATLRQKLTAAG